MTVVQALVRIAESMAQLRSGYMDTLSLIRLTSDIHLTAKILSEGPCLHRGFFTPSHTLSQARILTSAKALAMEVLSLVISTMISASTVTSTVTSTEALTEALTEASTEASVSWVVLTMPSVVIIHLEMTALKGFIVTIHTIPHNQVATRAKGIGPLGLGIWQKCVVSASGPGIRRPSRTIATDSPFSHCPFWSSSP